MVTAELIYAAFGAVVSTCKVTLSYVHDTNQIKDRSPGLRFPAVGWNLPTPGMFVEGQATVFADTYSVRITFADQCDSDRGSVEMLMINGRMEAIAKATVIKFCDRYVFDTTEFQGVDLDLELIGPVTFPPFWDEGTTNLTGVTAEFTLKTTQPECVDQYFD